MTEEFLLGIAVSVYTIWKFSSLAGRLDRTHVRRDNALNSLRQHLALRATSVARLVASGKLDERTTEELKSALEKILDESENTFRDYLTAESELTDVLCEVFSDQISIDVFAKSTKDAKLLYELTRACKRVQLARRFHNDAVGASQLLHARTAVRLFRLAGHTQVPTAVDLDDRVPAGLQNI